MTSLSSTGANPHARSLSISSKILTMMERIITIIKDLENSQNVKDLAKLNNLLWRAMDNLKEFELGVLQLQVPTPHLHKRIHHIILCPGCGEVWPHGDDYDHTRLKR